MINCLLDTNILLDFLLDREPFAGAAEQVILAHQSGRFSASMSVISPVNIFYIVHRLLGKEQARSLVKELLRVIPVQPTGSDIPVSAIQLPIEDYEDALQVEIAQSAGLDYIITRDLKDYLNSSIPTLTPQDFLVMIG